MCSATTTTPSRPGKFKTPEPASQSPVPGVLVRRYPASVDQLGLVSQILRICQESIGGIGRAELGRVIGWPHELLGRGLPRLADALPLEHLPQGEQQDPDIQPERPVIDVPDVQAELLLPGDGI